MSKRLEQEILEFILWLTPCGEVSPSPSVATIGREARKLNRKIMRRKRENRCTCPAAVDITFIGHLPDCPATR